MIRRLFTAAVVAAAFTGPGFAQDGGADAALLVKARGAIKGLAESLRPTLMNALEAGGPVAAIEACQGLAPAIATEQSTARGLTVGRTALRVRNPDNAPDAWERKVLETFAAKIDAGANPDTVDFGEAVMTDGRRSFRYMKAIPMAAEPCLACHGGELKPEIAAEIAKRYPQDEAVGFVPGKLRGAFTVTIAAD